MAHYIVSYDLRKQRNYEPLWTALHDCGAVRLLESLWVASLDQGAGAVRDALQSYIDSDDGLVVIQLQTGSHWASVHALKAGVDWLQRNIRAC